MAKLTVVLAVTAAASSVYARSGGMMVHELKDRAPPDFALQGPGSPDQTLELQFALTQTNFLALEEALYAVSTPGNSRYGQHLTKEEVNAFIAPATDAVSAVQAWLSANRLSAKSISPSGDMLQVSLNVSQANTLLDADFGVFTHERTGAKVVRTMAYSLPSHLKNHINFVHPTVAFPVNSKSTARIKTGSSLDVTARPKREDIPESCNVTATPACLQVMYEIPSELFSQTTTSIGVTGFLDEYASKADLELYLKTYRPDIPPSTTFAFESVNGGQNPQNGTFGNEADFDIQMVMGLASEVPTTFFSVGGEGDIGDWMDLANFLLAMDDPPQVLTTSYSFNEPNVPIGMATQLCNAFAQLGARGTTLIFSSGDGGVSGGVITDCTTFVPSFPSTCPYVTSVGATAFIPPEIPWAYTSGGFSNYFPRPPYQTAPVTAYLAALNGTNAGLYNASGRGFPDVSATGVDVAHVFNGELMRGGGTSFSAPIFAGLVGVLNAELERAGRGPVGFLNPVVYGSGGAFRDVVGGSNPGCGTDGFSAVEGWDPVTGMGTPLYSKLRVVVGL